MTEIYSRLVDHTITNTTEINDFSVGSAMRAIYESVAIELEQFYILTRENIKEAIERGVYESFGFTRKKSTRAYGTVGIFFYTQTQQEYVISRGTRFTSDSNAYPQVYETQVDYIIPKGSMSAELEIFCLSPGSYGNIPAGVINIMNTPMMNIDRVINLSAFQTGQDEEPLDELRARFRAYIESLSRATVPALEYGAREVQEVSGVYVHEQTGLVTIYAHDRNGNLTDLVKQKVEQNMFKFRPAGIKVVVRPVTRKTVDVSVVVTLRNKSAITNRLRKNIQNEVERYLNNMKTSQNLILTDLSTVIMNIDRQLIYDVNIDLDDNIYLEGNEVIRAGQITIILK